MPQKYHFEHITMPVPDRIGLCPRCKTALVYHPDHGKPTCHKCGNDEEGIPFVRLAAVLNLFAAPAMAPYDPAIRTLFELIKSLGEPRG